MGPFDKILVANRGEIAVRIIRTARKLGMKTLAVYAADDQCSEHVSLADEAVLLEGSLLSETYLDQDKLIALAVEKGAGAIHPGYGFLSENAGFAEKVEAAGLVFIGATAEQIRAMGEKTKAIAFVRNLQIPVIPSISGSINDILAQKDQLEFPLLIKASGGGGGKGMEVAHAQEQLPQALQQAQRAAQQYFGNDEIFVEKYLPLARHIEVQILGDGKGEVVHLFERECSIQRRYQKLVEEAPAASVSHQLKEKLYQAAIKIARSIQYRGAGTIEFLVDDEENFYFLEMNTRLQVEHPVTEMITGIDLVEWQLKIAAGEKLHLAQEKIVQKGHAIELRVCAEDAAAGFVPTSGKIAEIHVPGNCRWDSFLKSGVTLSSAYDSLLGKLVVHGENRSAALKKIKETIGALFISGIKTNQDLLLNVLVHPDFEKNSVHTRWLESKVEKIIDLIKQKEQDAPAPELLAAYLLHHFYRPPDSKSVWHQPGFRRIYEVFHIWLNHKACKLVIEKGENFHFSWNGKQFALKNCHFRGSKIEFQINNKDITIFISEKNQTTIVQHEGICHELRSNHVLSQVRLNKSHGEKLVQSKHEVLADLFGKVVQVLVKPGDSLQKGQNLMVIESMKSEFTIQSPVDAVVKNIHVTKGKIVHDKELLVDFES